MKLATTQVKHIQASVHNKALQRASQVIMERGCGAPKKVK
jgi:hypothetical protein